MADLQLNRPAAGQRVDYAEMQDARVVLGFPAGDAVLERVGDNLVFTFDDQSSIVLHNFYATYTRETLPEFVIDGQPVSGEQFFAALGEDLMPAAGPAAAAQADGNRYRDYDNADLYNGIDRLNGLDISSNRNSEPDNGLDPYGSRAGDGFVDTQPLVIDHYHTLVENALSPADVANGNALTGSIPGDGLHAFAWGDTGSHYGTFTANPDGTYSFLLANGTPQVEGLREGEQVQEVFTFAYTDQDGDIATGRVVVTIVGVNDGVTLTAQGQQLTVKESGVGTELDANGQDVALVDPNADYAGAPTAGSSFTVTDADYNDARYLAVTLDGVQQIARTEVTGNISTYTVDTYTIDAITGQRVQTGTLTITATKVDANTTTYAYEYHLDDAAANFLNEGDDLSYSFTLNIGDASTSGDYTIDVTLRGTNEQPELALKDHAGNLLGAGSVAGTVVEGGAYYDASTPLTGSFTVQDGDADGQTGLNAGGEYNHTFAIAGLSSSGTVGGVAGTQNITGNSGSSTFAGNAISYEGTYGTLHLDPTTGKYHYELKTDPSGKPLIDVLDKGDQWQETFAITTTDRHGATDTQQITINVQGGESQTQLIGGDGSLVFKESGVGADMNGALLAPNDTYAGSFTASGQFAVQDKDAHEVFQFRIVGATGESSWVTVANNASTTFDLAYGTVTVTVALGADNKPQFSYTYDMKGDQLGNNDDVFDKLNAYSNAPGASHAAGVDHFKDDFSIEVTDRTDPSDASTGSNVVTHDVDVLIKGTNERPELAITQNTWNLQEDSYQTLSESGAPGNATNDTSVINGTFAVTDGDQDGAWTSGGANANHAYTFTGYAASGTTHPGGALSVNNGGIGQSSTYATPYGTLTVNPDGTYKYVLDHAKVQYLGQGETLTETFKVTVTDIHGASHAQNITINIAGTNDNPIINGSSGALNLKEKGVAGDSGLSTGPNDPITGKETDSASFSVTDADLSDKLTATVYNAQGTAVMTIAEGQTSFYEDTYGKLTVTAARDPGTGTVNYSYKYELYNQNTATEKLTQGQAVNNEYTIKVSDDHGGQPVEHKVDVTIEGTNDRPTLSVSSLTVKEAGVYGGNTDTTADLGGSLLAGEHKLSASGTVVGADVDKDAALTYSITRPPVGTTVTSGTSAAGNPTQIFDVLGYGKLTLDTVTGKYTFELNGEKGDLADQLGQGTNKTLNFTARVTDEHDSWNEKAFTVTIKGTNDKPELTLDKSILVVKEDVTYTDSGDGSHIDVDKGDTHSYSITNANGQNGTNVLVGKYGTLTLDKATGEYKYTLNNSDPRVQELHDGESLTDEVFYITVKDQHGAWDTKPLNITVQGTNDAPVFTTPAYVHELREEGVGNSYLDPTQPYQGNDAFPDAKATVTVELKATDVDKGDTQKLTFYLVGSNGQRVSELDTTYGKVTLTVDPITGKVSYTYEMIDARANALAAGEKANESFKVVVVDESGLSTEQVHTVNIVGTNDRPTITDTGSLLFTEDGGVYTNSAFITATDVDSNDNLLRYSLVKDDQPVQTLEGKYGYLELNQHTGEYTYHLYNDKVQSLASGQSVTESFPARVTDDLGAYSEKPIVITITGADDKPSVSGVSGMTEDTARVQGTLAWRDADTLDTLQGYRYDGDTSKVISNDGTTLKLQGEYGVITINLTTGAYTYDLDIAKVQYLNIGENEPRFVTESFPITVTTGQGGVNSSNQGSITITINGLNDAPQFTAEHEILTVDPGQLTTSGQVWATDVDNGYYTAASPDTELNFFFLGRDGDKTGADLDTSPGKDIVQTVVGKYGSITINPVTGEYTYTLDTNSSAYWGIGDGKTGEETFTVYVGDPHGAQDTLTITVTVQGKDPGTPGGTTHQAKLTAEDLEVKEDVDRDSNPNDGIITDSGQVVSDKGTGNFHFMNGGTPVQTLDGRYGAITINPDGTYTYTLNNDSNAVQRLAEDESRTESFTVFDGYGNLANISVTVLGTNDQPIINSVQDLTVVQAEPVDHQSVQGKVDATDIDLTDRYTLQYAFDDGNGGTTQIRDVLYKGAVVGTITIDKNTGEYVFDLTTNTNLTQDDVIRESITVIVDDQSGMPNATNTANINLTIQGTNQAPTLSATTCTVTEDRALVGSGFFAAAASDDTAGLKYGASFESGAAGTIIAGTYGTLVLDPNTGEYTYRLNNGLDSVQELGEGESLTDTFTITVTDKHGASTSNSFTVTVEGTNDVPLLFVEPNLVISEGETVIRGQATGYDKDVNDRSTFGYSLDTGRLETTNDYGSFAIDPTTGAYTFMLDNTSDAVKALALGEVKELTYTVQLTSLGDIVQETVTVYIKGTNTTPVLTLDVPAMQEDTILTWNGQVTGTDTDHNATLQYFLNQGGSNVQRIEGTYGVIVLDPKTGAYTYTLNNSADAVQKLAEGQTEYDTFKVVVQDEHGAKHELELNVAVKGTNDVPTITSAPNLSVTEQTAPTTNGTIAATDKDATDVLLYGIKDKGEAADGTPASASGSYGTLTVDKDGNYTYTLDNRADALAKGETKTESFTLTVNDQHGGVVEKTITVNITGTNNAPTIETNTYTADIDDVTDKSGGYPATTGTLTYADVDHGASASVVVGGGSLGAPDSGLSNAFKGQLGTLTAVKSADGTINYTYTLHAGAAALISGLSESETFTLFVKDQYGAYVGQEVTFNVTGVNDAPTIVLDDAQKELVLTDPILVATLSGSLALADPDGTTPAVSITSGSEVGGVITVQGDYGVLRYHTGDNTYTYTLDPVTPATVEALANGTLQESFHFTASDGSLDAHDTLCIDITATDHAYVMSANEGSFTATVGSYVLGSTGDDLIYGSGENDVLFGGAGSDYLHGGDGNNQLYGGEGNDILVFNTTNSVMDGGAGIDFLVGVTDVHSLDTLLGTGAVSNIDVIVTGADSMSLTSLSDFATIGLTVSGGANDPQLTIDADKWTQDATAEHVPNGYTAYTHDEMTIFVAKSLLENHGG